jgi:hypothetical protein
VEWSLVRLRTKRQTLQLEAVCPLAFLAEGFASSFYSAIDFHTRRKLRKKKEKYPVEFHTAAGNCFGKL